MADSGVSFVVTGLRRRGRGSGGSSLSDISGWRGGTLYPLAGGSRAARRRRRFLFRLDRRRWPSSGVSFVVTGLRRRREGSPASSLSDISGWRGGTLYPLAGGSRAARRRRRFLFDLISTAMAELGGQFRCDRLAPAPGGVSGVFSLGFPADAVVVFIHWRVAAERRRRRRFHF